MARAWLPTDATSAILVGWFDAQDASTLTVENGGGISAWRSKVGGWGVTQATVANQPPYSTYNNLPAVFPTTDSQFLSGAAPAALPTGGDAGSMSGVGTVIAYRNTYSTMFYYGSANANKARSIAATGNAVSSGYYGNDVQGNVTWPGYTRLFISSISAAGYAEQWVDGGAVQAAQKNVLSTPAASTFWICRSINGDPWKNPVQEICLWKGTLSADERALHEGYYAWRWNLVYQLPASHRWKNEQPMVSGGPTLSAGGGAIVISGRTANLLFGHTLPAAVGSFTAAGQTVRTTAARRLMAGIGAFGVAGQPAALRQNRMLFAAGVSISLTGRPANLLHGYSLPGSGGTVSLTGVAAQLRRSRQLTTAVGSIQLTGVAASLNRVGRYGMDAAPGTFATSGSAAGLRLNRRLSAAPGRFDLAGGVATLAKPGRLRIDAVVGVFGISAAEVRGRADRRLIATERRIAWEGAPAVLRVARRLRADPGSFSWTPSSARLVFGQAGAPIVVPATRRVTLTSTGSRRLVLTSTGSRRLTL